LFENTLDKPLNEDNKSSRPVDIQRGSEEESTGPRFLVIGRITKPHGVHGEMRVKILTDEPKRFTWLEEVYIGKNNPQPSKVETVRFHKSWALLKLQDCNDRDAANLLRSYLVQVPESEGIALEEGEYYLHQLIGLQVQTEESEYLGSIAEVIETKANNVFVVNNDGAEILLPDIGEVIRDIDFDSGIVTVRLLPGLVP
jgi:16S rRNA processing protein RimM